MVEIWWSMTKTTLDYEKPIMSCPTMFELNTISSLSAPLIRKRRKLATHAQKLIRLGKAIMNGVTSLSADCLQMHRNCLTNQGTRTTRNSLKQVSEEYHNECLLQVWDQSHVWFVWKRTEVTNMWLMDRWTDIQMEMPIPIILYSFRD